jgi:hypothetical protein
MLQNINDNVNDNDNWLRDECATLEERVEWILP